MSKKTGNAPLSPKKYMTTKARFLPLHKCYVNKDWRHSGMAHVVITRIHVNGNITAGMLLVDLMHAGLKDGVEYFNMPKNEFYDYLEDYGFEDLFEEIDYTLAHNIVYAGIEIAEDQGLNPIKKAGLAFYILDEDSDDIELMDIPTGIDFLIKNQHDSGDGEDYECFEEEDWDEFLDANPNINFSEAHPDLIFYLFIHILEQENEDILTTPYDVEDVPHTFDVPETYYVSDEESSRLNEIYEVLEISDAKEGFMVLTNQLERAIKEYDNPVFSSLFVSLYQSVGNDQMAMEKAKEIMDKFPDYIPVFIQYGEMLLDRKDFDAFNKAFPPPYNLIDIFPKYEAIYYEDILPFLSLIVYYFVLQKDALNAFRYAEIYHGFLLEDSEFKDLEETPLQAKVNEKYFEFKIEYCQRYIRNFA
ncbi:MAG: hypothetical protein ACK4ND_10600 [Cytophagaceae bacterium]